MKKHQTVLITPGQMKELASAVIESIPVDLSQEEAQEWIGNKGMLSEGIRRILKREEESPDLISDWQKFYQEVFGIKVDFSNLEIPERQKGFDRLIIIAKGMTSQRLFDKCQELFSCQKWTDKSLDKVVNSERTAEKGPYAIWLRNRVEADEELKNLSADDLKKQSIIGITLEERLIYELKYFKETGKHLDIKSITLCSGSRFSDGFVPNVRWSIDRLSVDWDRPDNCFDGLRSRQAVS